MTNLPEASVHSVCGGRLISSEIEIEYGGTSTTPLQFNEFDVAMQSCLQVSEAGGTNYESIMEGNNQYFGKG